MRRRLAVALSAFRAFLDRSFAAVRQWRLSITLPGKASSFTSDARGEASVFLNLGEPASELMVTFLAPTSGQLCDPYSVSWMPHPSGARLHFVGLAASTSYDVKVRFTRFARSSHGP